jgi:hypothetical protein
LVELTLLEKDLVPLRRLARFLDDSIPVPGTSYRIGVEAVIGLIPGIGDFIGTVLSSYIILRAANLGASAATLGRMIVNVLIEGVLGGFPVVGDVFDAVWKANLRNIALLEKELAAGAPMRSRIAVVASVGCVLLLLLAAVLALIVVAINGAYEILSRSLT